VSNRFAIPTVTAALKARISQAISGMGATAKLGRPATTAGSTGGGFEVYIYLYQVTPNPAWRNEDAPTRRADGTPIQRATVALDLHYLVIFPGNHDVIPQVLLGLVARQLHARPALDRDLVRAVCVGDLTESDLAESRELVRVVPSVLTLEEVSKLWAVLQPPYILSMAYVASPVLIEQDEAPGGALPVLTSNVLQPQPAILGVAGRVEGFVLPFKAPVIERVRFRPAAGAPVDGPVTYDDTWQVVVTGSDLLGTVTGLRIDGSDALVTPATATQSELSFPMALLDRAGVHNVQVVHQTRYSTSSVPHDGTASGAAAFGVRPRVNFSASVTSPGGVEQVTVLAGEITPAVRLGQRAVLLLNEVGVAAPQRPRSFAVEHPRLTAVTDDLTFDLTGVGEVPLRGRFLARLMLDGVESALVGGGTGPFTGPLVEFAP